MFKPSFLLLILIYCILHRPYKMSIYNAFLIGIIIDLISGSTLGIQALTLSIISYFIIINVYFFRSLSLLSQSFMIFIISMIIDIIIFFIEYCALKNASFQPKFFLKSVTNGLVWPLLVSIFNKIRFLI